MLGLGLMWARFYRIWVRIMDRVNVLFCLFIRI